MVSTGRTFAFVLRTISHRARPRGGLGRATAATAGARNVHAAAAGRALPSAAAALPMSRKAGARALSSEAAAAPAPAPKARGSTLFQRLSSFLAGVGVTSLIGFYFLYNDVKRSTELLKSSLGDITARLDRLEK